MQKAVIFLALTLASAAVAQEPENSSKAHAEAGEGDAGPGPSSRSNAIAKPDPIQACIKSICPGIEGAAYARQQMNRLYKQMRENPGSFQYSERANAVFQKLKNSIERNFEKRKKQMLSAKIDESIHWTPSARAVLNHLFFGSITKHLAFSNGTVNPTDTKLNLASAGFDAPTQDWVAARAQLVYSPENLRLMDAYQLTPNPREFVERFVNQDVALGVRSVLESYEAFLSKLNKVDPTVTRFLRLGDSFRQIEGLKEKLNSGATSFTDAELTTIPLVHVILATMQVALSPDAPGNEKLAFDVVKMMSARWGKPEEWAEKMEKFLKDDLERKNSEIAMCRANYLVQQAILPTQAQKAELLKRVDRLRGTVKERLLSKFSESTRKALGAQVDELTFFAPPTREDLDNRYERVLTREASREEEYMGTSRLDEKERPYYVQLGTVMTSLLAEKPQALCTDLNVQPIPDSMWISGGIQLGPLAATGDEDFANLIVLHEMGHFLSRQFKKGQASSHSFGKYKVARECLREMHPAAYSPRSSEIASVPNQAYSVGFLTEEDFADLVSGTVQGKAGTNGMCHLIEANDDGQGFGNSYCVPYQGDPHSGNTFRLIHFEQLRGKPLSDACKGVLKHSHQVEEIKLCAWE